jgi:hypothetical protein
MIVTGKSLDRRTLLRGLGTAIALPLLDAMSPALRAAPKPPVRLMFGMVPNGVTMKEWTPSAVGKSFEFTRVLKPLEALRQQTLVITGLAHKTGASKEAGDHARAGGTFLTGVHPKRTTNAAQIEVGISADQVAAQIVGKQTRLASLELACEATRMVGSCDAGYSCAYQAALSWRSASMPMPPEVNPRQVFERLFGSLDASLDPAPRNAMAADRASVLDFVNKRTHRLTATLGPADRRKIDEYLTSIREIEKRIQRSESDQKQVNPTIEKPDGIPTNFVEHVSLMHDLLAVALQADMTRVSTMMYAREGSNRSYPELGFSDAHHPITHHRYIPDLVEKVTRINLHHMEQFAAFAAKLAAIPEGDGSLLDNCMLCYGSSISDGNAHSHVNLPVVVVGRGGGAIQTGQHLKLSQTPMTNLFLTLLDRMGVPTEKLGDSDGQLHQIVGV